ncbi:MAG: hypothetical protein U5R31_02445 [Acidimicrobiia bacterium]|nr:hypothetical protein [Acidimicrobiia bacterium]
MYAALIEQSRGRPVVMVVDDLHDADSALLETLTGVARYPAARSLLVVGATRPLDHVADPDQRAALTALVSADHTARPRPPASRSSRNRTPLGRRARRHAATIRRWRRSGPGPGATCSSPSSSARTLAGGEGPSVRGDSLPTALQEHIATRVARLPAATATVLRRGHGPGWSRHGGRAGRPDR